jgi:hypothetical protein
MLLTIALSEAAAFNLGLIIFHLSQRPTASPWDDSDTGHCVGRPGFLGQSMAMPSRRQAWGRSPEQAPIVKVR